MTWSLDRHTGGGESQNAITTLRRLARPVSSTSVERCDLCNLALAPRHRHLLETARHRIVCCCDGCALTFEGVVGGRFKLIPQEIHRLSGDEISDEAWDQLALPINLAFLFHDSPSGKCIAMFPSPAGATQSLLTPALDSQFLTKLLPDVEALLVNRTNGARDHFIAPIDRCFELAGLVRAHWRGLSGGDKVWQEVENFFSMLRGMAREEITPMEVGNA